MSVICPHCKQKIEDPDALLCLYCGESLERGIGFFGHMKYPTPRLAVICAILIILTAFLILILFS